jgi:hypothetical protein
LHFKHLQVPTVNFVEAHLFCSSLMLVHRVFEDSMSGPPGVLTLRNNGTMSLARL